MTKAETNFQYAYNLIVKNEGLYSNNPSDKGGETYRGITRKYNKSWRGWQYVNRRGCYLGYDYGYFADFWAKDYYLGIWTREGFDRILDKELAAYLFDYRIHAFYARTNIEKVAKDMGIPITVDNKFNPEELEFFNFLSPKDFLYRVRDVRIEHYHRIVRRDQTQLVWLTGWINRTKIQSL